MDPRLSWTVKRRDGCGQRQDRQLEDLQGYVRELCASAFPHQDGYVTSTSDLAGPIEGSCIAVARGDFRALVSVQAYRRGDPAGLPERELRLVACAGSQRIADGERCLERATRSWSMVGVLIGILAAFGVASMASAAVGLAPAMLLSPENLVLLALPILIGGFSISLAGRTFGRIRGRRFLMRAREVARRDRRLQTDMDRWNRVLEDLAGQRVIVAEQLDPKPFRTAGAPARPLLARCP